MPPLPPLSPPPRRIARGRIGIDPTKKWVEQSRVKSVRTPVVRNNEGYYQPGLIEGMGEVVTPPPRNIPHIDPDPLPSSSYNFQPHIPGMTPPGVEPVVVDGVAEPNYTWFDHFTAGTKRGADYSANSKQYGFARSAIWNRAPQDEWVDLNGAGRAGFMAGRIGTDFLGHGSRSVVWRIHPADAVGTTGMEAVKNVGGNRLAQIATMAGSVAALDLLSNNINYGNPAQGFRPDGFAATDPNSDDPRQTENLLMEAFNRGVLGRTGRLLPWEQFHAERPDVDYETYADYQQYLRDPGLMGIARGTWDGVDGPEARIMGYRVTPLGILGAAGTIGSAALGIKALKDLKFRQTFPGRIAGR